MPNLVLCRKYRPIAARPSASSGLTPLPRNPRFPALPTTIFASQNLGGSLLSYTGAASPPPTPLCGLRFFVSLLCLSPIIA